MQALFQQELPDCLTGDWQLTQCHIQHPRYKTYLNQNSRSKSFLAAAYHLHGKGKQNKAQDKILYVKAFLGKRSQDEYKKACADFQGNRQNEPLHIEKYGMVTWFFPHDPALVGLPAIMDAERARCNVLGLLPSTQGSVSDAVKDITVAVINYRPEIRCTFRHEVHLVSGASQVLYGKLFADAKGTEIYRRNSLLYQRGKSNPESFALPYAIAYDASLSTLWMEGLPGRSLVEILNADNADKLMKQIACHLADFHQAEFVGLETITEDDLLTEIQKKSLKLQSAFPLLSQRIGDIVATLADEIKTLPKIPSQLIHGDFHIQQLLLLADNRIALFDFDELALASPLVDVANFCADLYNLNLPSQRVERFIHKLFAAYQQASAIEISAAHFSWHLQVQLLTRAYRSYIQQKSNCLQLVNQFVMLAESGYADNSGQAYV